MHCSILLPIFFVYTLTQKENFTLDQDSLGILINMPLQAFKVLCFTVAIN